MFGCKALKEAVATLTQERDEARREATQLAQDKRNLKADLDNCHCQIAELEKKLAAKKTPTPRAKKA